MILWNERRSKKFWNFCWMYYLKTIETYYVRCEKYTTNEDSSIIKNKQNRLLLLSNCAICGKTKWTFIKNQELSKWLV